MIRIREIAMPPEHSVQQLSFEAAKLLHISTSKILRLTIVRRSVDARKKPDVRIVYTVDVAVSGNENRIVKQCGCKRAGLAPTARYQMPKPCPAPAQRPVVVGFGPAGMFAALILARAGWKPLVLERGADVYTRQEAVSKFFREGKLDPQSNVQFGEGGAGTFSDGKLNTGLNNPRIGWVLEQFVQFGAPEDILFDAKPHIGTDVLVTVVERLRKELLSLGAEVRFCTKVTGICRENGKLTGVKTETGACIPCSCAVFAIGHSARDTFRMLLADGIAMEPKPFAMGVRIEHRQDRINHAQYGRNTPVLPPADYKLVCHLEDRTVYSFCMCPGGYVVAAASEPGQLVTNGMSNRDRDGENANAALLVSVHPSEFPGDSPLAGMLWQEELERAAWYAGGENYRAPAQRVGDFLAGKASTGPGTVIPTYQPGVTWCDLHTVLPESITRALETAIPKLEENLTGFSHPDAVLTAPETRSSSPVRILRGADRQAALQGFYPCGEGAGYAGGILSAALDGIATAEAILASIR